MTALPLATIQRLRVGTILIVVCSASYLPAQEAVKPKGRLISGQSFTGSLTGVNENWQLLFNNGSNNTQSVSLDALELWGEYRERIKGSLILFTDGSRLIADVLAVDSDELTIESAYWLEAKLPLESLRGVVLQPPTDPGNRDRLLKRITSATGGQDQLLLTKDRIISGTLVPGKKGDNGLRHVTLRPKGERKASEISADQIVALIFNPALARPGRRRDAKALVGFRDGSQLHLKKLSGSDDQLACELTSGQRLRFEPSAASPRAWDWITALQPSHPSVVYLSDLDSLGYRHQPFLTLPWSYQRDRNVLGGHLRHKGVLFAKGVGMHSRSRLAYELDGKYRRFSAQLAVDDRAAAKGSVVCLVYTQSNAAGGELGSWSSAYRSKHIRGGEPLVNVDLNVKGVQRLALIVDFGERGDERDYLNWLNARLIK